MSAITFNPVIPHQVYKQAKKLKRSNSVVPTINELKRLQLKSKKTRHL